MKKMLFVVTALSLLNLSSAISEPTHPNEVGLYTTRDGYGPTGTFEVGSPVEVYLVLTKPIDLIGGGLPHSTVSSFECRLNFNPSGGLFLLGEILSPNGINIGDNSHLGDGYLEYIFAGDDMPVVDEAVVLIEFLFLYNNASPVEVTLGPSSASSIPGEMAFLSRDFYPDWNINVMHSVSGSHEAPVFIFNGEAVAVENESFGAVKALYR